jgi:hypothetical protein
LIPRGFEFPHNSIPAQFFLPLFFKPMVQMGPH